MRRVLQEQECEAERDNQRLPDAEIEWQKCTEGGEGGGKGSREITER
jgi:hypothetical protein